MIDPLRKVLIVPLIALLSFIPLTSYSSQSAAQTLKPVAPVTQRWICRKHVCHHRAWWSKMARYALALKKHEQQVALSAWFTGLAANSFPPPDLATVINCIYSHESGNYSESSHPGAGSGAAQWTPPTWQHWSAAAGHGGYTYAFLAPPPVQQDVLVYTLRNGGAHNWDPAFGNDPCTVGMP